jgi:hypothetical protein
MPATPPTPAQRPAEYAGVAGSVALLVAHLLGVDDAATITSLAVVIGFLPAAVTWIVTLVKTPNRPR